MKRTHFNLNSASRSFHVFAGKLSQLQIHYFYTQLFFFSLGQEELSLVLVLGSRRDKILELLRSAAQQTLLLRAEVNDTKIKPKSVFSPHLCTGGQCQFPACTSPCCRQPLSWSGDIIG